MKESIKNLPKSPGVYRFLDEKGEVLYIGKAKNLKNRLKQYFMKELGRGPAIEQMVAMAADIKWIETDSEIEAVLLEAELIKKFRPKYNIRLKDDKSFLVIKITRRTTDNRQQTTAKGKKASGDRQQTTDQGRVDLVRFKNIDMKDKSADYFGPYPAGLLLKKSVRYLRRIFPFADCSKSKFNTYRRRGRACIFGDLGLCEGNCVKDSLERSWKNISYLKRFLRGHKKTVISDLAKEIKTLSKAQKYEEAAIVRNQLLALEHLNSVAIGIRDDVFDSSSILFKRIECYDIANIGSEYAVGSMVVFTNGKPDKDEYRHFRVKNEKSQVKSDLERLKQVLKRRFKNDWPLPDLIVIDGGDQQLKIAKEVVKKLGLDIPLVSISKGPKRQKNDLHFGDGNVAKYFQSDKNLEKVIISARDEAHRFAISYYRKIHRKGLIEN